MFEEAGVVVKSGVVEVDGSVNVQIRRRGRMVWCKCSCPAKRNEWCSTNSSQAFCDEVSLIDRKSITSEYDEFNHQ